MIDKSKLTLIGRIDVDSGTVMIVDPCYVIDERFTKATYDSLRDSSFGTDNHQAHIDVYRAVTTGTYYGDGGYSVYAELERTPKQWEMSDIDKKMAESGFQFMQEHGIDVSREQFMQERIDGAWSVRKLDNAMQEFDDETKTITTVRPKYLVIDFDGSFYDEEEDE